MNSTSITFRLIFFLKIFSSLYARLPCEIHDDEIACQSSEFYNFNSSSMNSSMTRSVQAIHLINGYYSGMLAENIHNLTIVDYSYKAFLSPFISPSTLHNLFIDHTVLSIFPAWLCTYNKNLSVIAIDYSYIEEIVEHDLHLCLNLRTLRIRNSVLRQFTNSYDVELFLSNLHLSHNHLTEISREHGLNLNQFPYLRSLDLSNNQIKTVSSDNFDRTSSLKQLNLSHNHLENFQFNNMCHLIFLEKFDLRGNNYLNINENWYDYLPYLINIYLPYAYFCCNYKKNLPSLYEKNNKKLKSDKTLSLFNDENKNKPRDESNTISVSFHLDQVCLPLPDQMTQCESLFSSAFIRFIFSIIVFVSVISNLTALIISLCRLITSSYNRWSISTVLSSNLALADFISSIYLVLVGIIDMRFNERFFIKTQLWTNSHLCTIAGFIYIFGIQSSIYALTLLTFERFYTILFSFKRQTPWPPKFTLTFISLGWLISFIVASLPLININNFHANSLCVPFRVENVFDRLYLFLLITFDICFIAIIITCNGLICFNFSKSHVHTSNDARATLKILTLVIAICISRIPLIIFIVFALLICPSYSHSISDYDLHFNNIKLAVLFLQPFSSCFNPFMYSSLSALKWTQTTTEFDRPKPVRKALELSRFRSVSAIFNRGYYPLRIMSTSSLEYRLSSSSNTT
ncbi:unnamed protein product [Rotaria socialis]|uniref:G-protein coupled receptors family 1 profile domain-containing protein n=2 Tax=Rotaria socialis TaxID=392032 RepID=A0A817SR16_9BILA|nr:unnamed protein product [Rotaria socialis]CAF4108604.1 unnamed protein product [Rotaria socialis]